jgi:hypothetical protein
MRSGLHRQLLREWSREGLNRPRFGLVEAAGVDPDTLSAALD